VIFRSKKKFRYGIPAYTGPFRVLYTNIYLLEEEAMEILQSHLLEVNRRFRGERRPDGDGSGHL
jgi:hypothetical protein